MNKKTTFNLLALIIFISNGLSGVLATEALTEELSPKVGDIKTSIQKAPAVDLEELRKRISFEDKIPANAISHKEFMQLVETGSISEVEKLELTNLAYTSGNPILYQKAEQQITPTDYSINFVWIHKTPVQCMGHFMDPERTKPTLLEDTIITPLKRWAHKQPEAIFNLWYDSQMLPMNSNGVENLGKQLPGIKFRDLRTIKSVAEHPELFSADVALYYRVDLAKAIVSQHQLDETEETYVITTDMDIVPLTRSHLFDFRTLDILHIFPFQFLDCRGMDGENGFMLFRRDEVFIEAHREIMLKPQFMNETEPKCRAAEGVFSNYKKLIETARYDFREKHHQGFNTYVRQNRNYYDPNGSNGKQAVTEISQFGISGYTPEQVEILRPLLEQGGKKD